MEKHPLHLKNPELQTSPEVQRAVEREEQKTGEKVPNDPAERIEAYTDRLENIFLNPDERKRKRNLEMFRDKIYNALIIKRENFPDSYFELQKRIARERGQAVEEIPENVREQMMDVAIEDQKHSLDAWMDYLTSNDAVYPAWFKYFVWRNITKLSQFDKERGEFKKRTDSTVAPYPDIYREPLAQITDIYEKVKEDNKNLKEPEIREAFSKKFPNLYAELISKSLAASIENREEVRGQWVKYEQGDNAEAERLFQSLEGKGTGWCTAGRSTAETQIESGDFYVYYTNNSQGNPTQPRLAIRMEDKDRIGEVRGILPHQNIEPTMQEVLDGKLKEFGTEADAYRKKSGDMRLLTGLEKKRENDQPFTKEDLIFLYEVNSTIEGFGYEKDPRIAELRQGRNLEEDMLVVFECTKDQIAHVPSEINENTKAYVGQLEPGIFQKLPENLEHVYASFPEKKIRRENIEIGGKSAEQLISEMEAASINISDYVKSMLKNREFVPSKNPEEATLIRLTIADLGFRRSATTDQIYERAQALGLKLCPPDTGPNYRLKYRNQPLGEWFYIGMKQISDSDGNPHVFALVRDDVGLWLRDVWA
ncbi:MAG TPA: hypothetical protein VMU70_02375 [Candidatus Tyrphobacter sp.]|nr:hypothetical protein [Candidatus Tyrphobacter sp.]